MSNSKPLGGSVTCNSIKVDNLGNAFVTGYFEATADFDPGPGIANLTSAGGKDVFIAKYSPAGNYVYARAMGGASQESTPGDNGQSIAIDGSGNVYITGSFMGTADFDPSAGIANLVSEAGADFFIAKYDGNGNYVYAKSMGGTSDDFGKSIAVDELGNIYVTGGYYGTVDFDPGAGVANLNTGGMFFGKYDGSGNYVYAKGLNGANGSSIVTDVTGNIFITGSYIGTVDFDPGPSESNLTCLGSGDLFVARYDVTGNYVYAKRIGGISNPGDGYFAVGNSIAIDASGNTYIIGGFSGVIDFDPDAGEENLTGAGIFFAKYNVDGHYVFAKSIGSGSWQNGTGIALDANSNLLITGYFGGTLDFDPGPETAELSSGQSSSSIFVAKYGVTGNYVYAKVISGNYGDNISYCVGADGLGNTYTAGSFVGTVDFDPGVGTSNLSIEGTNAFVSCLNSDGNYVWAKQLGNYSSTRLIEEGNSIVVDGFGNAFVTGYFNGTVDFDPGPGTANLTSAGDKDIFIAKYDAAGNYVFAKGIGGPETDEGYGLAIDAQGSIYVTGAFKGTANFNPGAGEVNLTSNGSWDIFLAKYDGNGHFVYAKAMGGSGEDIAQGIVIDGPGNAYITGYFVGTADFDPGINAVNLTSKGSSDVFIAKYDATGNFVYAKGMGGTNYTFGQHIAIDITGHVFITGTFYGTADFDPGPGVFNLATAGEGDVFFAKYDASGNYVYAKAIRGASYEVASGIAADATGNVYLTGRFEGSTDFDPGIGIAYLPSTRNGYLAKYDATGNYVFATTFGSDGIAVGNDIIADPSGIYVTGHFSGTVDFDRGAGVSNLNSTGESDIFLAKYDFSGNYQYAKGMGGLTIDEGNSIAVDGSNNVYVTGYFTGTAEFDLPGGSLNSTIVAPNYLDIFIAKYSLPNTLPVTLLSFYAKSNNKADAVLVSWRTVSEINNAFFEVERSSNGVLFEKLGRVNGCGTCSATQEYNLMDYQPYTGTSYYRLKQVDYNNTFSYSRIVSVESLAKVITTMQVNPNLTDGTFKLIVKETANDKRVKIQVYNQAGALIKQQAFNLQKGDNAFDFNLSNQPNGVYYISMTGEKGVTIATSKVIRK